MCIQDHCEVQDDEKWQTPDEMPFLGLVANDVHGNHSANGAANEAEPKQARLWSTPPVVVATLCNMLIPGECDEGDDVKHSQVDTHDPQLAQIPAREDASKAFTLPGIDGKLRGYLTPRGQIITSVAAGTTNALATLDQSQPISVQNIQEDTHDLTGKKMSFGTVDDRDQLTKPKYVAGTVGQFSSQLSIYADGTFMADADQSKVGEKDVTGIATVSGHFSFPNGVKKNQPFALHLDRLEYGNKPDSQQTIDSLEDGMQFTTYIYGLYDDDNHRPDLSKDLISDYMFYPAGTDQSALLPGMEGVADRVGLTNGKTAKSIIVGVRNGRAIKGYFVGNNPEE